MAGRLEPGAERLLVLRTPLATARTLPWPRVQQHDDAVGLAQLVGAQHDPVVAVQRPPAAHRLIDPAEAALAALVLAHRVEEVLAAEVGPQHVGEDELAVGQLPQQEVGDAVLARRADHEVGVGHLGVVEVAADRLLVDLVAGVAPSATRPAPRRRSRPGRRS